MAGTINFSTGFWVDTTGPDDEPDGNPDTPAGSVYALLYTGFYQAYLGPSRSGFSSSGSTNATNAIGTGGNDEIWSADIGSTIYGRGGNDEIYGYTGDDILYGEEGEDTLIGDGADKLYGGEHADVLQVSDGDGLIADGGSGNDYFLMGGDPWISGTLIGGAGIDTLDANYELETLTISEIEILEGVSWSGFASQFQDFQTIWWGAQDANETVFIQLVAAGAATTLNLTTSLDSNGGRGAEIYGTSDDETITGGSQEDYIVGEDGNDRLFGGDGDDIIYDLAGSTTHIDAGAGDDTVSVDSLFTSGTVAGGADTDTLIAYDISALNVSGFEIWDGGVFKGKASQFAAFESLWFEEDQKNETVIIELVSSGANTSVNFTSLLDDNGGRGTNVYGSGDNETITVAQDVGFAVGDGFLNIVEAAGGNDTINGGKHADFFFGDAGNDKFFGGKGNDVLYGGAGSDEFAGIGLFSTSDQGGKNEIWGFFDYDLSTTDKVVYQSSSAAYDIRPRIFEDSLTWGIEVSNPAGTNVDTVKNWNKLVFSDRTLNETELWNKGAIAHGVWAFADAFDDVRAFVGKLDAFKDSDGNPKYERILKWFDVADKTVGILGQTLTASDAKTAATTLITKTVSAVTEPFIDTAEAILKEAAGRLPDSLEADAKEQIDQGVADFKAAIALATASTVEAVIDVGNDLKNKDWKNWMDGLLGEAEEKYKDDNGSIFDKPRDQFDNPNQKPPKLDSPDKQDTETDGDDVIILGKKADTVHPGDGDDLVFVAGGDDKIIAGSGKGDDFYDGGEDTDTIAYTSTKKGVTVDLTKEIGSGREVDDDTIVNIENVTGGSGADKISGDREDNVLVGGSGNDKLLGLNGKDTLEGGNGKDSLEGGRHNDILVGGKDRDKLWGGKNNDVFDFNAVNESRSGSNRDIIYDFERGRDTIDLKTIDAQTGSGNQRFKWIGEDDFNKKKGELRYEDKGSKVIVQGDVKGNGKADFEIYVFTSKLGADDFVL